MPETFAPTVIASELCSLTICHSLLQRRVWYRFLQSKARATISIILN